MPERDPNSSIDRFKEENEIDRMAREGGKTEWQERSAPAAGDPVSDDEKRGLNVLGQSDPRGDGALYGASDANAGDLPRADPLTAPGDAERRNPPLDTSMDETIL